jgi:Lamin Tail Domain
MFHLLTLLLAVSASALLLVGCPGTEVDDDDDTYNEDDDAGDDDAGDDDGGDDDGGDDDSGDDDGGDDDSGDDDGGDDDSGDDDGGDDDTEPTPSPGDILFIEVMQNSDVVNDAQGEWFELLNVTNADLEIGGCTISDAGTDSFTIVGPLTILAGDYFVLGVNADTGTNGNITVDYEYSGMQLGNGDDELILDCGGEIDRIEWDGGINWPDPAGAAMNLDEDFLGDNNNGLNWCEATSAIPGSTDLGTPGATNDECVPVGDDDTGDDDTGDDDDTSPAQAVEQSENGWRIHFKRPFFKDDDATPS